jgi:Uma2 family endonuclease
MATARLKLPPTDPTEYPVSDDVGEDSLQRFIAELLRPLLEQLCASRRETAFVGADQFIYWKQFAPKKSLAPDVYVLPGVSPKRRVRVWKVWETGIVPSFALEVVSDDDRKDTEDSPRRYDELGVGELVIFDPDHRARRDGVRFRVYRRLPRRGLVLVEATNEDRVRSKALSCWLRAVGAGDATRLRVGLGPRGEKLMPTDAERAEEAAERADRAAERADRAAERADKAEAELAALRARLAKAERRKQR